MHRMHRSAVVAVTLALTLLASVGAARHTAPNETLPPAADSVRRSSDWLGLLPDGEEKRRFILDCTGCHVLDARIARTGGRTRTREEWETAVQRMRAFAGASSGFPVMSAHRDTFRTAEWLVQQLGDREPARATSTARRGEAEIREYDLPEPGDLPHDLALDRDGRVVVTGMFTHRMYVVDPASGAVQLDSIPIAKANPRAVEIDGAGNWWVVLGGPQRIARRDTTGRWESWPVGVYAHSIALGGGAVWANGHFTRDPELLVRLDPASGDTASRAAPPHPLLATVAGGPVPYELRAGGDGHVWLSELQGNRIVGHDPEAAAFTVHELPTPFSGPRRFDVDAAGVLWIPGYASNELVRFDPATQRFESFPLPTPSSAPYVARVDRTRGTVWIGTGASDELLAFDPRSRQFTAYPLPTRGALIRHIAVDERNNEVWAAYGASPVQVPARIARLIPQPSS